MLNYDVHTSERDIELLESEVRGLGVEGNPFPGLRPFGIDECHLFFGREGQVDEVLMKLSQNRFVAVMGFSGSGKSSLMYCGLIPVLYGGFMTHAGPNWNVVVTRPGISPIDNLAESILQTNAEFRGLSEEDKLIRHTVTSSILRSGVKGLVDVAKNIKEETGENLLILVDQFEELFRFSKDEVDQVGTNESVLFINMLLEAIQQEDTPIYLALTMRSEFIGDCARFPGLTEMINMSNYLVPLMTREQKRLAIEGPVAVGGGRISSALVKRLLNDLGDQQDQLPILQHALMRSWNYWLDNREEDEPLDIRHYNAIGGIEEALSLHANEAFDELTDRQKAIAEVLFKSITEKSNDGIGIRRPARLQEIAEIAGADEEEVKQVVNAFRMKGRSLLMPPETVDLDSDSIIEVSHESLIRIWTRLKSWVNEESESARMYLRISDAAAMYQVGRTGLWRPPDLQLALNWQKKQNPTRVWAQRYDEAFERAIVFLDTSRITYEAEQKNQEQLQKQLLNRTRRVAFIMAIAALIAIVLFIFGIQQRGEALTQAANAELARAAAEQARDDATANALLARENELDALAANAQARRELIRGRVLLQKAVASQDYATQQRMAADEQRRRAEEQTAIAVAARDSTNAALRNERLAKQEALDANAAKDRAVYLAEAQSMALKSQNVTDLALQSGLALGAFSYNRNYNGWKYEPAIYSGLYEANAASYGQGYHEYAGHRDGVRSIAFSKNADNFFSAGADGSVIKWDVNDPSNYEVVVEAQERPNLVIRTSPDGQWLAVGSDSTAIQLVSTADGSVREIGGHKSLVNDIAFAPDGSGFYSTSFDQTIRFYDFRNSRTIKVLQRPLRSMAISPNGEYLIGGTTDGRLLRIGTDGGSEFELLKTDGRIYAVSINPQGTLIAYADQNNQTHVVNASDGSEVATLVGHTSIINVVRFSPDGKLIASGSNDGTIQMYATDELNELPIVMDNRSGYVWDLDFSHDSQFLVGATQSDILKIWPTDPAYFAEELAPRLGTDITEDDWSKYIKNVKFERVSDIYNQSGSEE